MSTEDKIFPLFPTPIFFSKLSPTIITDAKVFLDKEEFRDKPEQSKLKYGEVSNSSYILDKEEYQPLKSLILQKVKYYCNEILGYGYDSYTPTQSWISVKTLFQQHVKHFHPHSLISGVLFFGEISNKTPALKFHRSDEFSKHQTGHKYNNHINIKSLSLINQEFSLPYELNSLVLFPSILEHSVPKNVSHTPRKSLAFNIVPTEGFGTEESLTELKFN